MAVSTNCRVEGCLQPSMWCGLCAGHCDGTEQHGEYRAEDPDDDINTEFVNDR